MSHRRADFVMARLVIDHRLSPSDPLGFPRNEEAMTDALLSDKTVTLEAAANLIAD